MADLSTKTITKNGKLRLVVAPDPALLATAVTAAQNDVVPTRPDINVPGDGNKFYKDFN